MASRNFSQLDCLGEERVVIAGSFRPNGASAVNNALNTGLGFSVAWTATGLFTITLADAYAELVSATASIQMAAATDVKPQWRAINVTTATGGTLQLASLAIATDTDIASNAGNRVHFVLVLKNTTVKP
jgi:hypothetical protein